MKKGFLIFYIFIIFIIHACGDKENVIIRNENLTISHHDTLNYYVGTFVGVEFASITIDPEFAVLSEFRTDPNNGETEYLYRADTTFVGDDYLEIKTAKDIDNDGDNDNIGLLKLTIKVVE